MNVAGGLAPGSIEISRMDNVPRDLDKREDEDDDSADINADGTGPIRDGMISSPCIKLTRQGAQLTCSSCESSSALHKTSDPKLVSN